jgi:hypothetical protein
VFTLLLFTFFCFVRSRVAVYIRSVHCYPDSGWQGAVLYDLLRCRVAGITASIAGDLLCRFSTDFDSSSAMSIKTTIILFHWMRNKYIHRICEMKYIKY